MRVPAHDHAPSPSAHSHGQSVPNIADGDFPKVFKKCHFWQGSHGGKYSRDKGEKAGEKGKKFRTSQDWEILNPNPYQAPGGGRPHSKHPRPEAVSAAAVHPLCLAAAAALAAAPSAVQAAAVGLPACRQACREPAFSSGSRHREVAPRTVFRHLRSRWGHGDITAYTSAGATARSGKQLQPSQLPRRPLPRTARRLCHGWPRRRCCRGRSVGSQLLAGVHCLHADN